MEAAEAQQEFLGGAGEISGRGVERGSPGRGGGSYRYKKKKKVFQTKGNFSIPRPSPFEIAC